MVPLVAKTAGTKTMKNAKITKSENGVYIVEVQGFEFHVQRFGKKWEVEGHDTRGAVGPGTFEGSDYEKSDAAIDLACRKCGEDVWPPKTTSLKAMVAWLEANVEPSPVEPTPEPTPEPETRHAHLPPVSVAVKTLRAALSTNGLKWSGNTIPTQTRLQVESVEAVYEVIRTVLHTHAIEGAGLSGGSMEIYPLQDGATFFVDWVSMESTHAVLTITRMAKAY